MSQKIKHLDKATPYKDEKKIRKMTGLEKVSKAKSEI